MPLIQWIMNLQTSPVVLLRPSRIINYSIGQIVCDLNGKKWKITDFNAYGTKETEYHVEYGNKRKKIKDSEIAYCLDYNPKINCLNELQICINNYYKDKN